MQAKLCLGDKKIYLNIISKMFLSLSNSLRFFFDDLGLYVS